MKFIQYVRHRILIAPCPLIFTALLNYQRVKPFI
jgi:hypothetical protein